MLNLIPRDEAFFNLLEAAAKNLLIASRLFRDLCEDYRDVTERVKVIQDLEHEGDKITHELLDKLDRTFVVPLDREDIYALTRGVDDIVDAIEMVSVRLSLYRIDEPTRAAVSLARILVRCCEEIDVAMPLLRNKALIRGAYVHCVEIDRLENQADSVVRQALMGLFEDPKDAMSVLKWKEFYDVLEGAIDKTENVADLLRAIVLKAV